MAGVEESLDLLTRITIKPLHSSSWKAHDDYLAILYKN
jgi:hypothetical protein